MEPRYVFGPFSLDPQARSLTRGEVRVELTSKVLDTLLVLIRAGGRLVGKDELVREVWPESVVEENNLSVTISKLRAALGETAHDWRYIETVARRGYRFASAVRMEEPGATSGTAGRPATRPAASSVPRVAALPLKCSAEDEYIAEGMTEALITALGRISALRVISHQSVRGFRDSTLPLSAVAKALKADLVVEGSVFRLADLIWTTLRLIDAARDEQLWGESYDRSLPETLRLMGGVARAIAREAVIQLTPQDETRLTSVARFDSDALEPYLQGRYFTDRNTEAGIRQGQRYFYEAIGKDPAYAAAHAALAYSTFLLALFGATPWAEAVMEGTRRAEAAVRNDPMSSDAHISLGVVRQFFAWDWTGAEWAFRRAIELSPGSVWAHKELGLLLGRMGKLHEGLAELKHVRAIDPLSLLAFNGLPELYYYNRDYDAAIESSRMALEMAPDAAWPRVLQGLSCLQKRLYAEAIDAFQQAVAGSGDHPFTLGSLGYGYAVTGNQEQAQAALCRLMAQADQGKDVAMFVGLIYLGAGEEAKAMEWFERACDTRSGWICWLKVDPRLHHLHATSRFASLLRRTGLEP